MRCTPWLLSLACLTVACSDDPVTQPPPSNKDASVGNDDATAGNLDAAPGPMDAAGPSGPCDPVTGGNCVMGQNCYYDTNLMRSECRIPIGNPLGGNEVACALGANDCEPGYHCINPGGGAVCLKACNSNTECMGLMGSGMNGYFCAMFNIANAPKLCIPRPNTCDVYTQMCPMNGNCTLINNDGDLGCVQSGTVAPGGGCDHGPCARGGHCFDLNMTGPHCYAACDGTHACPMGAGQCANVMPPLPWGGICIQ